MMLTRFAVGLLLAATLSAQPNRVDPRNSYTRVVCVVPLVGSGTSADPKRPQYAPWPASTDQNGIIAFYFEPTDDGKSAVVEFVARNRKAFQPIFDNKSVTVFEKGRAARSDIETALKRVRKDFDLDKFGLVMP
jgi:hypothetical protein